MSGAANSGQPQQTGFVGAISTSSALGSTTTAQPVFGASSSASDFSSFGRSAPTTRNVFASAGTSIFGQSTAQAADDRAGTSIAKYKPIIDYDTIITCGQIININTKLQCITAMKEYEAKSLDELRMEDYLANRKGSQAAIRLNSPRPFGYVYEGGPFAPGAALFGATTHKTSRLFKQPAAARTQNKSQFGNITFGKPTTPVFGAANKLQQKNSFLSNPFCAPDHLSFEEVANDAANLFGPKPDLEQTAAPSLFGQQSAARAAPAFGQTNTDFEGVGNTARQQRQPSLSDQPTAADTNKPASGLGAASTGNSGFDGICAAANTNAPSSWLFSAKPPTGLRAAPPFDFTSQSSAGFAKFCMSNTADGDGLFNSTLSKPAASNFDEFGTETSTAPLNFNTDSGAVENTADKPDELFGNTMNTGTANTGGFFGSDNKKKLLFFFILILTFGEFGSWPWPEPCLGFFLVGMIERQWKLKIVCFSFLILFFFDP